MMHVSYVLQDEYDRLLEKKKQLEREYHQQSKRKRESCEQGAETRHDNADYEDAERQQNLLGSRMQLLQKTIQESKITLYDALQNKQGKIVIGCSVSLQMDGKVYEHIIGGHPSLPGRISYMSPLGQAILQKQVGDKIIFQHNSTKKYITILSVT